MRNFVMAALFLPMVAAPLAAGEIFGTLSEGPKAVDAGVKLEIAISGKTYEGETDKFGSYRIIVKETGKCTLTVHYKDQSPAFQIVSYDKARRYDFVLEPKDGVFFLRRK